MSCAHSELRKCSGALERSGLFPQSVFPGQGEWERSEGSFSGMRRGKDSPSQVLWCVLVPLQGWSSGVDAIKLQKQEAEGNGHIKVTSLRLFWF